MGNLQNPTQQYDRYQTKVEAIEKCLDENIDQTYYLSISNGNEVTINQQEAWITKYF